MQKTYLFWAIFHFSAVSWSILNSQVKVPRVSRGTLTNHNPGTLWQGRTGSGGSASCISVCLVEWLGGSLSGSIIFMLSVCVIGSFEMELFDDVDRSAERSRVSILSFERGRLSDRGDLVDIPELLSRGGGVRGTLLSGERLRDR